MSSKIDLNFNVNEILEKFSIENLKLMRNELIRFRAYDLDRISTTEICLCKYSTPCNKNAIYLDRRNGNKPLCWYHALLLTKG